MKTTRQRLLAKFPWLASKASSFTGSGSRRDRSAWRPIAESLEPRLLLSGTPLYDTSLFADPQAYMQTALESYQYAPADFQNNSPFTQEQLDQKNVEEIQWLGVDTLVYDGQWIVDLDLIAGGGGDGQGQTVEDRVDLAQSLLEGAFVAGGGQGATPNHIQVVQELGEEGLFLVEIEEGWEFSDILPALQGLDDAFSYLEPNGMVWAEATVPNDQFYGQLWGMEKIDAPEAWDTTTGGKSGDLVVVVIDTGIDYTHQDLRDNMWTNPGEVAGNGVDDDGNGFVDDVYGYNFVSSNGNPYDDHYHGTHCAGTIAGVGNNGIGVTGVMWDAQLMAVKILDSGGSGSWAGAISGINYTAMMLERGVNVLVSSNSWGGGGASGLQQAVERYGQAGGLFVAAAGNNGSSSTFYPAGYSSANIISVAASDENDNRASFSNYGASWVDIAAPGVGIFSCKPGNQYQSLNGTSMATPHVAGAAALLWDLVGTDNATWQDIQEVLYQSVDPLSWGSQLSTGGRLNLAKAMELLDWTVESSTPADGQVVRTPVTDFTVNFTAELDVYTLQAQDFTLNGVAADDVQVVDADTVVFVFDQTPLTASGPYVMQIADGAIERLSDGRGITGWSGSILYDASDLYVTTTEPAGGSQAAVPFDRLKVHFSEAINPASVSASDLETSLGQVVGVQVIDQNTVEFFLIGVVDENAGPLHVHMDAGAVTDPWGFGSFAFDATYYLDAGPQKLPRLTAVAPLGVGVYKTSSQGLISPDSDQDDFLISLDVDQALSLYITPDETLRARVIVKDASGTVILNRTAAGSGELLVVENLALPRSGKYTITVASDGATHGHYAIQMWTGGVQERESLGLPSNDTRPTAQDLDGAMIAVTDDAWAASAVGRGDATGNVDWYSFTLDAQQAASLVATDHDGTPLEMLLYNAQGELMAFASEGFDNVSQEIHGLVAPETGQYYVSVVADGDYTFTVLKDAGFDVESNDSAADAVDITVGGSALGYLNTGDQDWYRITVTAGDVLRLLTSTPGDAPYEPINILDPYIELYDAAGNLLGSDDWGADDGINAQMWYEVTGDEGGELYIRVSNADGWSTGQYTLDINGATYTLPPLEVVATVPEDGAYLPSAPFVLEVDFSENMLLSSVDAADLLIDGAAVEGVVLIDGDTVRFELPMLGEGEHTFTIVGGSISSLGGVGVSAYTGVFTVDLTPPKVLRTNIAEGDALDSGQVVFEAVLSEPILLSNLDVNDVRLRSQLNGYFDAASVSFDTATNTLRVVYNDLPEDSFTLTLISGYGRFVDRAGNHLDGEAHWPLPPNGSGDDVAGGDFVVNFEVDAAVLAFPALRPLGWDGSLVYQGAINDKLRFGTDTDSYTLQIDAGQRVTWLLDAASSLRSTITLVGPDGQVVDGLSAAAAGQSVALQTAPVDQAGLYTLVVSSLGGSSGAYNLNAYLNAAVETGSFSDSENTTLGSAQDLDGAFFSVDGQGGSAERASIVRTRGEEVLLQEDFENTTLSAGWTTWSSDAYGRVRVSAFYGAAEGQRALLMDRATSGNNTLNEAVWTIDLSGQEKATLAFDHIEWSDEERPFTGPYTGHANADGISISNDGVHWYPVWNAVSQPHAEWQTYSIDLAAACQQYGLALSDLQVKFQQYDDTPITGDGRGFDDLKIIGPGAIEDWYSFHVEAGQTISLALEGLASDTQAVIQLYDAQGQIIAASDPTQATPSDLLTGLIIPESGEYYARVVGENMRYVLSVDRNAAIEAGAHATVAAAIDISIEGGVVGHLAQDDDLYAVRAVAGDSVTFALEAVADGDGAFPNTLSPRMELIDAAGQVIAVRDGSGGTLTHQVAADTTLYLRVTSSGAQRTQGEYLLTVSGHTLVLPSFQVTAASPNDGAILGATTYPDRLRLTFNDQVFRTTIDAQDVTVGGIACTGYEVIDGRTVEFFLPALADGTHAVVLAAGSLFDLQATPVQALTMQWTVDSVGPRVVASSIQQGEIVAADRLTYTVRFNEAMSAQGLDTDAVALWGAQLGAVEADAVALSADGLTLTVTFDRVVEDDFTLTLRSDRLTDLAGNPLDGEARWPLGEGSGDGVNGGDFVVRFDADIVQLQLVRSLFQREPLGSLVYTGASESAYSIHNAGDIDAFTIDLDAGQLLSLAINPGDALRAQVSLYGPDGVLRSYAAAPAAGQDVVLNCFVAPAAGTYRFQIASMSGSSDVYRFDVMLNAASEVELHTTTSNHEFANAQSIDAAFSPLDDGSKQAAVMGKVESTEQLTRINITGQTFDSGALDASWSVWSSNVQGRARMSANYGTATGNGKAFIMDRSPNGAFTLNELVWTVGLQGLQDVELSFWQREWSDEEDYFAGPFEGHYNADGVAISADGVHWFPIWSPAPQDTNYWVHHAINLGDAARAAGINLNDEFQIKFQQYDDQAISGDGRGWDDIAISIAGAPRDVYSVTLQAGESLSLAMSAISGNAQALELYDPQGNLVASGDRNHGNATAIVDQYQAGLSGRYTIVTSGYSMTYGLVATVDSAFECENNDALRRPHVLLGDSAVGYVEIGDVDCYAITGQVGERITLTTRTPGDTAYGFGNDLDSLLEVFDDSGNLIAIDDNGAGDGRNASLSFIVPESGTYTVRVSGLGLFAQGEYILDAQHGPADITAPVVTRVAVRGSAWSDSFRDALTANGYGQRDYELSIGANQEKVLPWTGINTVTVTFSEDVGYDANALSALESLFDLLGTNSGVVSAGAFIYDSQTYTATWTLSQPLTSDRFLIVLSDAVTDAAGNRLDGEWQNGTSTVSGDGSPEGMFGLRFSLLEGDVDRNQRIDQRDLNPVRQAYLKTAGQAGYSILADLDGNGRIDQRDLNPVRANYLQTLVADGPAMPGGLDPQAILALQSSSTGTTLLESLLGNDQEEDDDQTL
jgi:subtilisin family serine protease